MIARSLLLPGLGPRFWAEERALYNQSYEVNVVGTQPTALAIGVEENKCSPFAYLTPMLNVSRCSTQSVRPSWVLTTRSIFKKGPKRSKWGTMRLREFCGSLSCFVVLSHALGSICNGHPASRVIKNQDVTNSKNSIFNATAIS